jgi:DNA-binding transcriptional regulator GbsR (MarR family)
VSASDDEDERLPGRDEAVLRFVEKFALDLVTAGVPRMPARLFAGVLVADDGKRTAGELAELLGVSPAAVSGAVRYLEQVRLIAREREPGQRRDHYRVFDDLWYESIAHQDEQLVKWEQTLREGVEAVGPDSPAGARLEETRSFFAFLRRELPSLMDKWRQQRFRSAGS